MLRSEDGVGNASGGTKMARQLRVLATAPELPAGLNGSPGLKIPTERMRNALSGLLTAASESLAGARSAAMRLLPFRQSNAVTKPVSRPGPPAQVPAGRRVYAVGDIHGRADLLIRLLKELHADVSRGGFEGRPILIFLGDYIDRGFQSKDVLNVLLGDMLSPFETYFLKGNHEAAMLQFLGDPGIGPRWAEYGGAETLVSYGVQPPRARTSTDQWTQASEELHDALPPEHLQFLQNLDLSVRVGDYVFVHAGVRPGVPLDQQTEQDLLWIREEFLADRSLHEAVVVHGHTPAAQPYQDGRRIGIDTGAYLSGALTAARFEHDRVEFITTGARVEAAQPARV
jgi:serine/threonine protein phosphatase 1